MVARSAAHSSRFDQQVAARRPVSYRSGMGCGRPWGRCGGDAMRRSVTNVLLGLGLVGLMSGLTACNRFGDYCQAMMDCEGGNDKDVDACVANHKTAVDEYDLEGCSDWYDAYFDCLEQNSTCNNRQYGDTNDRCKSEHDDLGACNDL
jgi:hypothetical protein